MDSQKYVFRDSRGRDFFKETFPEWLDAPEPEMTEEEWNRPVYTVQGKLIAKTRREYEEKELWRGRK